MAVIISKHRPDDSECLSGDAKSPLLSESVSEPHCRESLPYSYHALCRWGNLNRIKSEGRAFRGRRLEVRGGMFP